MRTYRYSAMVKGKRRLVMITAQDGLDAHDVETLVDNTEKYYDMFYLNATDEEKDPDLRENVIVEAYGWYEVL